MSQKITQLAATVCLVLGLSGLLAGPAMAAKANPPLPEDLFFTVYRDGSPMGFHQVQFSTQGDLLIVRTEIELEVKIAFIKLFAYSHQSEEVWSNEELVSLTATTNDNGDEESVYVTRREGRLYVDG